MEDMLYEIESVRRFAGLRLTGPLPDETTILNFRHLLERHGLGRGFEEINAHLAERGYTGGDDRREHHRGAVRRRTGRGRDPEMPDEEQRVALRDPHIGVDAETGLLGVHARTRTSSGAGALLPAARRRCGRTHYRGIEREAVRCSHDERSTGRGGSRAGQGFGAQRWSTRCEAALRLPEGSLPRAGQEPDRTSGPNLLVAGRYSGVSGRPHPPRSQRGDHRPHAGLARFQPVIAPKTAETGSLRPAPPCSDLPYF